MKIQKGSVFAVVLGIASIAASEAVAGQFCTYQYGEGAKVDRQLEIDDGLDYSDIILASGTRLATAYRVIYSGYNSDQKYFLAAKPILHEHAQMAGLIEVIFDSYPYVSGELRVGDAFSPRGQMGKYVEYKFTCAN